MPTPVKPRATYQTSDLPEPALTTDRQPDSFWASTHVTRQRFVYLRREVIFSQGDCAQSVLYIQKGSIELSIASVEGKEAVVGILGAGDFVGEGCLAGMARRKTTARAITSVTALFIDKKEMIRVLHAERGFSDRFISYMVGRNIRAEENLVDQLFNSSEKRLARTLLMLSQHASDDELKTLLPQVSQEMLAKMVGTTRSRINFFMNKFRKLGLIQYNGRIHVNSSLLRLVLNDQNHAPSPLANEAPSSSIAGQPSIR